MKVLVVLAAVLAVAAARVSYDGYQVWRVTPSKDQVKGVVSVIEENLLDVWASSQEYVDVMVPPRMQRNIMKTLAKMRVSAEVYIPDVQKLVDRDYEAMAKRPKSKGMADFDFEVYHTLEEIEAYLTEVAANDSRVSLSSTGQTIEGRDTWMLTISNGAGKKPVYIDCTIHAREWITAATCLWGINFLLNGYGSDPDATQLLDKYDFLIQPVNNPDGYAYSHSDDRMWRKNRHIYPNNTCDGVDLNRNFDDHFGGQGTSDLVCSQTYRGEYAASEPETQNTQAALTRIAANAAAMFSIHSYTQMWMYPFGWTSLITPDEEAELDAVSVAGVTALTAVFGTQYTYGPVASTIYPAASTTIDYAYYAGIAHSYTLELRDDGTYGFLLPEDQIGDTALETWRGLAAGILAVP